MEKFKNFNIRIYDPNLIDLVSNPGDYHLPGIQKDIKSQSQLAEVCFNYLLSQGILKRKEKKQ